jgi:hypothetical protein
MSSIEQHLNMSLPFSTHFEQSDVKYFWVKTCYIGLFIVAQSSFLESNPMIL